MLTVHLTFIFQQLPFYFSTLLLAHENLLNFFLT